jgi:hypothetical protein
VRSSVRARADINDAAAERGGHSSVDGAAKDQEPRLIEESKFGGAQYATSLGRSFAFDDLGKCKPRAKAPEAPDEVDTDDAPENLRPATGWSVV